MESNIPFPSLKAGSTAEIEYVKRVLSQTVQYAHRTQVSAVYWHKHYLKALSHLAQMNTTVLRQLEGRRLEHASLVEQSMEDRRNIYLHTDILYDMFLSQFAVNKIIHSLFLKVLNRPNDEDSWYLSQQLSRFEDLSRCWEELAGGGGGSDSPVPGLEDLTSSSGESFFSFPSTPSDRFPDALPIPFASPVSPLPASSPSSSGGSSPDSVDNDDAEGVVNGEDVSGEGDGDISGGSRLGA